MHTAVTNTGHTHVSKNEASAMLTDVRFLHICICIPRAPRLCLEVDSPEEMKMMRKHMWGPVSRTERAVFQIARSYVLD